MLAVRTRQLTAEDFHLFRLAALSAAPGAGTTLASAPASPLCCAHGTTRVRRPSRAGRRPVPLLRGEGRRTLGLGWEAWATGEQKAAYGGTVLEGSFTVLPTNMP